MEAEKARGDVLEGICEKERLERSRLESVIKDERCKMAEEKERLEARAAAERAVSEEEKKMLVRRWSPHAMELGILRVPVACWRRADSNTSHASLSGLSRASDALLLVPGA